MDTSHKLFDAACAILGWFAEPPTSPEMAARLAELFQISDAERQAVEHTHLQLCSSWNSLSLEQHERIVDRLLVASCGQAFTGRLRVDSESISFAALTGPPVEPEAQGNDLETTHKYIELWVDIMHDNYVNVRKSETAAQDAAEWRHEMLDVLTVERLHEIGIVAATILSRMLSHAGEVSHLHPLSKAVRAYHGKLLMSPSELIEQAKAKARGLTPAERRFEDYRALVHAVVGLYSPACRANPLIEKRNRTYNFVEDTVVEWTSPAGFNDFQLLEPNESGHPSLHELALPEQHQKYVLSVARSYVFSICLGLRTTHTLPDANTLVKQFPTPGAIRPDAHRGASSSRAHEHADASLSHPARAISARYAQRYYGTTARAWQARQGGW
ncbi:hypothetical protein JCM3775_003150 [Rhodotorula graminis]